MADQEDVGSSAPAPEEGLGGLGAMRMMISGHSLAGQAQLDQLASGPVMDPANKWLRYAAASLAPTKGGGFNESLSNSLNAYADSGDKESELRAKYLPVIAQALLQREQMQFTQANTMYKLNTEWDSALTGSLTGLLSTPGGVTPSSVEQAILAQVRQNKVPMAFARNWAAALPADPTQLQSYIRQKTVSMMSADARLGAVSPKVEMQDTGGVKVPVNTNPNSGNTPVGAMPGVLPNSLTPKDRLPVETSTVRGPMVRSPTTGEAAYVGSPEAQALSAAAAGGAGGAPATPSAPVVPLSGPAGATGTQPVTVPGPTGSGISTSAQTDPVAMKLAETEATDFAKYTDSLNNKVSTLEDLNMRLGQERRYLSQFRTGATAEVRMKAAAMAKDLGATFGMPEAQTTAFANRIAGGDMGAAQAFQKLSTQGAMQALTSAMQASSGSTAGRITQAEFAIFVKNNPNIDMDPNATEKIFNFVSDQYAKALREQDYVSTSRAGGMPLNQIRSTMARTRAGFSPPTRATGVGKGTSPGTGSGALGTTLDGRPMVKNPQTGVWEYGE